MYWMLATVGSLLVFAALVGMWLQGGEDERLEKLERSNKG